MSGPDVPRLSVIVPVHDARSTIGPCLAAARAQLAAGDEVIVVDDASTDGGVPLDAAEGVTLVALEVNVGRGPARNIGAEAARGDVLVFVDADVVLRVGALDAIREAFADPDRSSLIGAYDDQPGAPGLVSQYRNLLHHRTHHTHGPTAMHFWTGLGAVRRTVFTEVGGFDSTDWTRDMEDVELGHRLVDAGHAIDVLPHVQGTHLKAFSLRSMVRTDLFHRAIPWSTLLLRTGFRRDDFVLSLAHALSVATAGLTVIALPAVLVSRSPAAAGVLVVAVALFLLVNAPLWRFLGRRRGWAFALGCVPLHFLHSISSGVGFVVAVAAHLGRVVSGRRRREPVVAPAPAAGGDRP